MLLCSFSRSSSLFSEVMQMNFEIASFSSLSGTQPIAWQVEYPRRATTDTAVSEIFISQKDLAGIVPLATVRCAATPAPRGVPLSVPGAWHPCLGESLYHFSASVTSLLASRHSLPLHPIYH